MVPDVCRPHPPIPDGRDLRMPLESERLKIQIVSPCYFLGHLLRKSGEWARELHIKRNRKEV